MLKILHNNRCSKSRQCLLLLTQNNVNIQVIDYIKNPLSEIEIRELLQKLKLPPIAVIRKKEPEWKENFKENFTDDELISLLVKYPKLIERPIVISENEAFIVRPPEKIFEWISLKKNK